jgi:hypothetical protein
MKVKIYALFCIIMMHISLTVGQDNINFLEILDAGQAQSYPSFVNDLLAKYDNSSSEQKPILRLQLKVADFLYEKIAPIIIKKDKKISPIRKFLMKNKISKPQGELDPRVSPLLLATSLSAQNQEIFQSVIEKLKKTFDLSIIALFFSAKDIDELKKYNKELTSPKIKIKVQEAFIALTKEKKEAFIARIKQKAVALNRYFSRCQSWANILIDYEIKLRHLHRLSDDDILNMAAELGTLVKRIRDLYDFYGITLEGTLPIDALEQNPNNIFDQVIVTFYATINQEITNAGKNANARRLERIINALVQFHKLSQLTNDQKLAFSKQVGLLEDIEAYAQGVLQQIASAFRLSLIDLTLVLNGLSTRLHAL